MKANSNNKIRRQWLKWKRRWPERDEKDRDKRKKANEDRDKKYEKDQDERNNERIHDENSENEDQVEKKRKWRKTT